MLRIEDTDITRCRAHFEDAIYEDLRWLGLSWEEPVRRQSDNFARYKEVLTSLQERGLAYRCYASRTEIAAAAQRSRDAPWQTDPLGAPRHPGPGRVLDAQEENSRRAEQRPYAIRLDMTRALAHIDAPITWTETDHEDQQQETVRAFPARWGDVALAGRDTPVMYNLAVVLDDAWQEITHVVRGRDIYPLTAIHRVLQSLLDLPAPRYHHHRLVRDAAGDKLAKSNRDTALRALRAAGTTPAQIAAMIGLALS